MLLRFLSRLFKQRQRSQGLVEYGVIAASVAFVGVAGFNALSGAQKAYLTDFPKNGDVPSAPGQLLHAVLMDPLACSPGVVALNSPVTCNSPTVYDNFKNPTDRNPPLGNVNFYVDGSTKIATCALVAFTPSSSACSTPTISWTPTDPALATGTPHTIEARYEQQTSNHFTGGTNQVSVVIQRPLTFVAARAPWEASPAVVGPTDYCLNYVISASPNTVEVGHPLLCTVKVTDSATSAPYAGKPVNWSVDNTATHGVNVFSCSTRGGADLAPMFTAGACPPSSSLSCTTDANGICSVVFRHLNNLMTSGGVGESHTVTISALASQSAPFGVHVTTTSLHVTYPMISCQILTYATVDTGGFTYRNLEVFPNITSKVAISPGYTGTVDCTAYVIDVDPNTALDCAWSSTPTCTIPPSPRPDPDMHDAHPPLGTVTWTWAGQSGPPPTCSVARVDFMSVQAPGQTPYASSCHNVLALNGTIDTKLTATYTSLGPTHLDSNHKIDLDFDGD